MTNVKKVRRNERIYRWEVATADGWMTLPWDSNAPFEYVKRYLDNQADGPAIVQWVRDEDVRRLAT